MRPLVFLTVPVAVVACINSGSLPQPISNGQADDPDQPGSGGTSTGAAPPIDAGSKVVALPGGAGGVGFDDLRFSGNLASLLVPGGRTGNLDFIDPSLELVSSVGGFSSAATYTKDTSFGVTSADEGNDVVYATDRTTKTLSVIDGKTRKVVGSPVALADVPGYVRYVAATNEVWVTEPASKQIEVFSLGTSGPTHAQSIAVAGAESLEIDATRGMAFTNDTSSTLALDVSKHAVSGTWPNGCKTSRGLAVDRAGGFVLTACEEGLVVVLAETSGAVLGKAAFGSGLDRLAYDSLRQRLYVPSPAASALGVVSIDSTTGAPALLGSVEATSDAHCAVTPGGGQVFVCVPSLGQLVYLYDPF